jgi:hypothetical protein
VLHHDSSQAYLLLYVDDIVLTANSTTLLNNIISKLHSEFAMTDLGPFQHFLGISVTQNSRGLLLSQEQYATELLDHANMTNCSPYLTPATANSKPSIIDGKPMANPTKYRSITGALHLTITRPDINFAVQQACLFMHAPTDLHFNLLKRILRYIKGTLSHGLHLSKASSCDLLIYSYVDWAGCPDTRRSTSGYCTYLGGNLVSWSSKWQNTVSKLSAEPEYRGVANVVTESCWLRQLLQELGISSQRATIVFCDNVNASYMSSNPVHQKWTKHIEIDLHFVQEKISIGEVKVLHVPSSRQFADIFTKGLPTRYQDCLRPCLMNFIAV